MCDKARLANHGVMYGLFFPELVSYFCDSILGYGGVSLYMTPTGPAQHSLSSNQTSSVILLYFIFLPIH
jgi:hypothetical protein